MSPAICQSKIITYFKLGTYFSSTIEMRKKTMQHKKK